ncbi:hypothetical protein L5515_006018 [Caenorhabditis briggsae]|uniref:Uncharacterized protein n=1 Tax=Caenorhabditis briggsae TaxID=6238 RepID=A0AAE9JHN2_CAEBR|nr:hypothetical protein L5515_006018 [Caenorhabditis briggsae]
MVVYLDLTEKTIDCFNECAKKGSYAKFVDENRNFIRTLSENLKKVKFPVNENIADMVSLKCKFYFDYLTKWNPRDPPAVVPGTTLLERYTPCFVNDLKQAISTRNWDKFYSEYYLGCHNRDPTADFIINEAKKQGVLDFQIQKGSGSYESFQERDVVVRNLKPITNDGIRVYPSTPLETENSGELNESRSKVNSPIATDSVTNNSDDFVLDNSTNSLQWDKDQSLGDIDRRIKLHVDDMKQTFQKDCEENVEKFMLEIKDSVSFMIETNEAKKTVLESKRKQEMNDLKLWLEERTDVRAAAIEKKIYKKFEELQNEHNESNRKINEKLSSLFEKLNRMMLSTTTKTPEATIETLDQEQRNDPILNGTIIENQNVSIAKLESIPETDSHHDTDHVEGEVNERVDNSDRANQDQQIYERSEVSDQVPQVSGYDSEEENHQRRLAEQNRIYGEKLKTIKERRNQLNKKATIENGEISERISRNAAGRYSVH